MPLKKEKKIKKTKVRKKSSKKVKKKTKVRKKSSKKVKKKN